MKKYIVILTIFLISSAQLKADGVGLGVSAIYNLQTESFGAGLRVNLKPSNLFRIVPQVAYYPSFNKIHEFYAGLGLEINVFKVKKYNFYLLGNVAYNGWLNHEASQMKKAKYGNIALEGGGGIAKNTGCWRPFIEYRYNGWWMETNLRLGIMYVFGCNDKGFGAVNKQRNKVGYCPAYYF